MEQYNRIEIRGLVGNVKITHFTDSSIANISVATNYAYTKRDGQTIMETTWFTVIARIGKIIETETSVAKGNAVFVTGRFRTRTFTDSEGNERTSNEVVAATLEVLKPERPLSPATM